MTTSHKAIIQLGQEKMPSVGQVAHAVERAIMRLQKTHLADRVCLDQNLIGLLDLRQNNYANCMITVSTGSLPTTVMYAHFSLGPKEKRSLQICMPLMDITVGNTGYVKAPEHAVSLSIGEWGESERILKKAAGCISELYGNGSYGLMRDQDCDWEIVENEHP